MPSGSDSPRRARADVLREKYEANRRERERKNSRLHIRADLREDPDEVEDTGVINQRELEAKRRLELPTVPDTPIPPKPTAFELAYAAVKRVPPWGLVLVMLAGIAAYTLLMLRDKLP